ncbi:MAG: response regulator, partial [Microcoleus sp. SIO2G3]|nr:response regulator [Microcoleus sp. SIO2G3]
YRAKDEFLSVLSHELRNPLNAMIGWAQLLRERQLDQTRTNHALEAIERSARTQAQLIEDILDVSRITTGKFRLNARLIDLAPVVGAAIEVVHLAADAKNIRIESRLSAQPEKVLGDPTRLQQVVWNLLSNAIKFTPAGGSISVQLEYANRQAQIQISDTGCGISAEFLPYIFDRFRQADGSRTRSNSGLGLGLSIVRHLVELHGGTVEAESSGVGQGATFTVRLPLQTVLEATPLDAAEPADLSDALEQLTGEVPSLTGLCVLVVDDEPGMRELFTAMLEKYGVEVTAIASANEAIATLSANPQKYDVLISDIGMPAGDGYALIRQIRSLSAESGGQIPAAALTAYARDEDHRESIAAGFQLHLTKPVEAEQLAWAVATLSRRV